jgi:hypothetical protein
MLFWETQRSARRGLRKRYQAAEYGEGDGEDDDGWLVMGEALVGVVREQVKNEKETRLGRAKWRLRPVSAPVR